MYRWQYSDLDVIRNAGKHVYDDENIEVFKYSKTIVLHVKKEVLGESLKVTVGRTTYKARSKSPLDSEVVQWATLYVFLLIDDICVELRDDIYLILHKGVKQIEVKRKKK
jgi:hypothetical protein